MQIINLSHENKLIYIGSDLYPLKGVLIEPVTADSTTNPNSIPTPQSYRTRPIVGDDWRVVADGWHGFNGEYGFAHDIIDPSKGPICVNHPALTDALDYAANQCDISTLQILEKAESMGLTLSNDGLEAKMHIFVEEGIKKGHYRIGNNWEIWDEYDANGFSRYYYVPTHTFDTEAKSSIYDRDKWIYNLEDLLFSLKRTVGAYTDFFHVKNLSVDVYFDDDIPEEVQSKIRTLVAQVNTYLRFIDDINQQAR